MVQASRRSRGIGRRFDVEQVLRGRVRLGLFVEGKPLLGALDQGRRDTGIIRVAVGKALQCQQGLLVGGLAIGAAEPGGKFFTGEDIAP